MEFYELDAEIVTQEGVPFDIRIGLTEGLYQLIRTVATNFKVDKVALLNISGCFLRPEGLTNEADIETVKIQTSFELGEANTLTNQLGKDILFKGLAGKPRKISLNRYNKRVLTQRYLTLVTTRIKSGTITSLAEARMLVYLEECKQYINITNDKEKYDMGLTKFNKGFDVIKREVEFFDIPDNHPVQEILEENRLK